MIGVRGVELSTTSKRNLIGHQARTTEFGKMYLRYRLARLDEHFLSAEGRLYGHAEILKEKGTIPRFCSSLANLRRWRVQSRC